MDAGQKSDKNIGGLPAEVVFWGLGTWNAIDVI